MKKIFLPFFLFACFFRVDAFGVSLLPFGHEKEKQRYVFRTLVNIERHPVWLCGDDDSESLSQDEIEKSIDAAFYERGLDPAEWNMDVDNALANATLTTQLNFYGKVLVIDVGLLSEALLLESQVFVPAIIWKQRTVLNLEGKGLRSEEEIAKHVTILVGHFLDDYLNAITL